MQVDIYIREKNGSREIRIPWLPEKILFKTGAATVATYDILNKGPVSVPTGTELAEYSWESEFPGKYRTDDSMMRGSWKDPKTYDSILKDWKESGEELTLLVTGFPINDDVYLADYEGELSGPFGDIAYSLSFAEQRDITIKATTTTKKTVKKRSTTKTDTYTVKPGDTLWGISEQLCGGGANWNSIYSANKEIIESTAKSRWAAAGIDRDSQNGHWIFPGTVLTIPQ